MRIDLAGWSSAGLRCPDIEVDLRLSDGGVPEVALIQMPNGTGKTTTLQLLNATLTGRAAAWDATRVRSFRRKGDTRGAGQFKATLLIDGKPLSIELNLDFDAGLARYKSTSPGSGGVVQRWSVPPAVHRFLAPEFLSLFIFDGEFADRLLDPGQAEADRAVDALCQIYLLEEVGAFIKDFWERSTRQQTSKSALGLGKWEEARAQLAARERTLKEARGKAKVRLTALEKEIADLDHKIKERLSSVEVTRDRHEQARDALIEAEGAVKTSSAALMTAMRLPHALNPGLGKRLSDLRDNLDRLKLPENTSAQFFEELLRETQCICGREMDEHARTEIRTRATYYLDADEAGTINALKRDIEQFTATTEEDAGHARVTRLTRDLAAAVRKERAADQQVRALKQQLIDGGDDQLEAWQHALDCCRAQYKEFDDLVAAIDGSGDADDDIDSMQSLSAISKRREEIESKIAEITKTVRLRDQTAFIQRILEQAIARARAQIKMELIQDCNARLATILASDPLEIERIDRSIRLANQEGASVGQTLSVGYTFLMSVLNRGSNGFPLIVDSPANPIDQGVRRRIGRLIPELCSQFVGLTINTERPGFVPALEAAAKRVTYLTLFRKTPGTQRLMKQLPVTGVIQTDNAVLVSDREYFNAFDVEDEEDEENAVQTTQ